MEDDQQPLGEEEEEVQADTVQHYICIYIYIMQKLSSCCGAHGCHIIMT